MEDFSAKNAVLDVWERHYKTRTIFSFPIVILQNEINLKYRCLNIDTYSYTLWSIRHSWNSSIGSSALEKRMNEREVNEGLVVIWAKQVDARDYITYHEIKAT